MARLRSWALEKAPSAKMTTSASTPSMAATVSVVVPRTGMPAGVSTSSEPGVVRAPSTV